MAVKETTGAANNSVQIDVRGLMCPLPVLKANKRLKSMAGGEILEVLVTDPAAVIDFPHYCSEAGHDLLDASEVDGIITFIIRKTHGS